MTTPKKSPRAIALIVLLLGLFIGSYFLGYKISAKKVDNITSSQKEMQYRYSRANNGPLAKTMAIKVTVSAKGTLSSKIASHEPYQIKQNQDVILFDKSDAILTSPAKVKSIDGDTLIITVPDIIKTDTLADNAQIVLFQTRRTHRLPLSALLYDEENKPFVWTIKETDTHTNSVITTKTMLDSVKIGDEFFTPRIKDSAYKHYILNPDAALKESATITAFETKFKAPLYPPLKQAIHNKKRAALKQHKDDMAKTRSECGAGGQNTPNPKTVEGNACKGKFSDKDPMQIIEDLIKRR